MTKNFPSLTVIGDVGVDLVLGPVDGWPAIGTETIVTRNEMRAGGSGGNSALAARHLGQPCRLISLTGSDDFGSWLRRQFGGVDSALTVQEGPTSLSVGILHSCGERTFFTTEGHLAAFSLQHVEANLETTPAKGSIALLSGVFLTPRLRARYGELIGLLRAHGYQVAIDTGWPSGGWSDELRAEILSWLEAADHILLNETEILHLADEPDLDTAMDRLAGRFGATTTLVAKTGPKGARAVCGPKRAAARAPEADAFDTIGAGDSFNAGYLFAQMKGLDLAASLAAGCMAASTIIARFPRMDIGPGELAPFAALIGLKASA